MIDLREKQAYLSASPDQLVVVQAHLSHILAALRAQYLSYQTSHWQVRGQTYYGNHLLFQRLYESVGDQIDEIAEKMVGYMGVDSVALEPQVIKVAAFCGRWSKIACHHRRGLASEKIVQEAFKQAYDKIKEAKAMTLGLDDWIMAAANAHETNEYLLQQVLDSPPQEHGRLVAAFFQDPKKRVVREFAETGAITNDPEVAESASTDDQLDLSSSQEVARADAAPPLPTETAQEPGGQELSTLNQYVVNSVEPGVPSKMAMRRWLEGLG